MTADLKYHDYFKADNSILLVDVGHYESEQFTKNLLYDILTKKFPNFAIALTKTNTKYVRSATLVDLIYSLILWYFKGYNDIPMSTTWVFVGLLAGRELAFATITGKYKFKTVFPLIGKDFFKMMIGLALSVAIVMLIHGFSGFANM